MTYGEACREAQEAVQNLRRIDRERTEQTDRLTKARAVIERYLSPEAPADPINWADQSQDTDRKVEELAG
mgnify:CR=1 FL=1